MKEVYFILLIIGCYMPFSRNQAGWLAGVRADGRIGGRAIVRTGRKRADSRTYGCTSGQTDRWGTANGRAGGSVGGRTGRRTDARTDGQAGRRTGGQDGIKFHQYANVPRRSLRK